MASSSRASGSSRTAEDPRKFFVEAFDGFSLVAERIFEDGGAVGRRMAFCFLLRASLTSVLGPVGTDLACLRSGRGLASLSSGLSDTP